MHQVSKSLRAVNRYVDFFTCIIISFLAQVSPLLWSGCLISYSFAHEAHIKIKIFKMLNQKDELLLENSS